MDPINDAKTSLNASQRIEVKELFGLLLDADEAGQSSTACSKQIMSTADKAIGSASFAVANAAKLLMDAHHRADTGLLCETDGFSAISSDYEQKIGSKITPPIINGYQIHEEIGRGGFGVVYRAEQLVPVQRAVAIKLLRTDLATQEMVARFQAEASVLARMNHEGIARVIDAGIDHDSRPFVAMDLIEGVSIVKYCQENTIPTRDRARLIEQVCDAVHHAHQRAVIHRDLKPANVLVESYNNRARPRVIDFGIAKLLEDGVVETNTLAGRRLGTPRYMSPEQRSGEGGIDIRIDVYALGVLICETLTGKVPHGNSGTKRSDKSSTRPSGLVDDDAPDNFVLARELKGDLDRIVLKAIANDPDMRYQSAAAMSDDIRRYLDGMPVLAKEASLVYRGSKFVKRHKATSSLAAIAGLAIILGGVGLAAGLQQAKSSQKIAQSALQDSERQLMRAEFVNQFLLEDMLGSIDPNVSLGRDITVREVFDIAYEKLSDRSDLDVQTQYTTLRLIGLSYRQIGAHDEAMNAFRKAADLADEFHGQPCKESIEIRMRLYDVIVGQGRSGMTKLGQELNQDVQQILDPNDTLYQSIRLRTTDSVDELIEIIDAMESDPQSDPDEQLKALASLGNLYSFSFQQGKEIEFRKKGYELSNQVYGPDHSATFGRLAHYAALKVRKDPDQKTLELLYQAYEPSRRILGLEHPVTLSSMRTYANLLGLLGDQGKAIELLEENERGYRARFGASSTPHTATCSVLGEHYLRANRPHDALEILLQVRDDRARQWSAGHVFNVIAHMNIAKCYIELGNGEGARIEAQAALDTVKANSLRESESILLLAKALVMLGQSDEAGIQLQRGVNAFRRLEPSSSIYFDVGDEFVKLLHSTGELDGAREFREELESSKSTI